MMQQLPGAPEPKPAAGPHGDNAGREHAAASSPTPTEMSASKGQRAKIESQLIQHIQELFPKLTGYVCPFSLSS